MSPRSQSRSASGWPTTSPRTVGVLGALGALALTCAASCVLETSPIVVGERNPSDPVMLAEGQIDPFDLVVDGTDVYWMDWLVPPPTGWAGTEDRLTVLMSIDTAGITEPVMFDYGEHQGSSANPSVIAADSSDVYWTDTWGRFRKIARAGTSDGVGMDASERIHALAIDTTHLYSLEQFVGTISQLDKATDSSTVMHASLGTLGANLAQDSTHLYWIRKGSFAEDAIVSATKTGSAPTVVVDSLAIEQLALDSSDIYFSNSNSIYKIAKTGGNPVVVASGVSPISELAIDSTHVYWGDIDAESEEPGVAIYRLSKADGSIVAVVDELPGVTDLALDSTHLYWTDRDGGTVMKLAK